MERCSDGLPCSTGAATRRQGMSLPPACARGFCCRAGRGDLVHIRSTGHDHGPDVLRVLGRALGNDQADGFAGEVVGQVLTQVAAAGIDFSGGLGTSQAVLFTDDPGRHVGCTGAY